LRGHGGPVRALAVSADGSEALSGSFDSSAIRWSLTRNNAEQVLRFHDDAVNAVALLADGRAVTGGADGRIALWSPGRSAPDAVLQGHTAPVVALAVSADGTMLASAAWDNTVRVWPVAGGAPRVLEGHSQNVNGVAFTPDGKAVVSASYDLTLRIWPLDGAPATIITLPAPLSAVAVAPDGEIVAAAQSGAVYFLDAAGRELNTVQASPTPVIALAVSRDGALIAAAGIRGSVAVIERAARQARPHPGRARPAGVVGRVPARQPHFAHRRHRPADPPLGRAHRRSHRRGRDGGRGRARRLRGDPGAEIFRACVACHTLTPDEGNRAGPTLAGIFGRRIASLPGYNFSQALRRLDIVWTRETVAKLFELGPVAYTAGHQDARSSASARKPTARRWWSSLAKATK
jgi:cytochrome c